MTDLYLPRGGRYAFEAIGGMDGFLFAASREEFLRRIGVDYLADLWRTLVPCLRRHGVDPDALRWGAGHPTYTAVHGGEPFLHSGWVVPSTGRGAAPAFWSGPWSLSHEGERLAACLRDLRMAKADIRATAVSTVVDGVDLVPVPPNDLESGLACLAQWIGDDAAAWAPTEFPDATTPCGQIAAALATRSSTRLHDGLEAARTTYSPAGYRMVARGFGNLLLNSARDDTPGMERPVPRVVTITMAGDLEIRLANRWDDRDEWLCLSVTVPDRPYAFGYVHADHVRRFCTALAHDPARLTSVGRRIEIDVAENMISVRSAGEPAAIERPVTAADRADLRTRLAAG